jgi:hypothetical protein
VAFWFGFLVAPLARGARARVTSVTPKIAVSAAIRMSPRD